jgi:hypothetical protein
MPDRMQFSAGELRLLCDCVATICVNIAGGRSPRRVLPAADAILADFGDAAHARLLEPGPDLTQLVLAEFSSSALRHDALTRVGRSFHGGRLKTEHFADTGHSAKGTASALELVDKRCRDQAFSFRAALILIAMAIEDKLTYGRAIPEPDSD